jgi:hypothetical protein
MKITLSWTKLPLQAASSSVKLPLKRSSHALVVRCDKAYIFGGEDKPREPVDGELYIIDLKGELSCYADRSYC